MKDETQLQEIRHLLLIKSGINIISPRDCNKISRDIYGGINKYISETTIKRFFGFAVQKHKFSNFVMEALSEYVGISYIKEEKILPLSQKRLDEWKLVKAKAKEISKATLTEIMDHAKIPYDMTIKRSFAEQNFKHFYKSDLTFTALISQPGYGKSIMLGHLAENLFYNQRALYRRATLLFANVRDFINVSDTNLCFEGQLKTMLGIEGGGLDYIDACQERYGSKFIIILDGINDSSLIEKEHEQLFNDLVKLICAIGDSKNIKLMISIRTSSWIPFYERICSSVYLRSKWFPGEYIADTNSNVPQFSEEEVGLIMLNMGCSDHHQINLQLRTLLKYPSYVELYFNLRGEDPTLDFYSNVTFYELVSRVIQQKVHKAMHYKHKYAVLKKILNLNDQQEWTYSILRGNLSAEISACKIGYNELLADEILSEEIIFEDGQSNIYVGFADSYLLEYFVFLELIEKFNFQIDEKLFNTIYVRCKFKPFCFQIIQWIIRFLIKTGNFTAIKSIFKFGLSSFEIKCLILFIAEEIKYRSKYNIDLIGLLHEDQFLETIISELIHLNFIDYSDPHKISEMMGTSKQKKANGYLFTYNSLLSIIGVIQEPVNVDLHHSNIAFK